MSWVIPAVAAGTQLVTSLLGNRAQKDAVRAQRKVDATNAAASNAVRRAGNGFSAAQAGLSNLMRSLTNQGNLREAGESVNALNTNLARLQDQATTGSLNQQIAAAEQLGAVRAQAAASGAGGTSSAMLHQTLQLAQARADTTREQNQQYQTYDMLAQRAGLISNMALAVDSGQSFANIDYGVDLAPYRAMPGNGLGDFLANGGMAALGNLAGSLFTASPAASPAAGAAAPKSVVFKHPSGSLQSYLL